MIRAHRLNASAIDDASLVSGWNIAPNIAYTILLFPSAASCGVLLYSAEEVLLASGAALVGASQPCVLRPQTASAIEMVDTEFGWHLLLTTTGMEPEQTVRIGPTVDLPDEIHPIYGEDSLALARATAAIDAAAHYVEDATISLPQGIDPALGDIISIPVDDAPFIGAVESITWTATPDGMNEQFVIRRHVAIAPEPYAPPAVPVLTDDVAAATHLLGTSGNVLTNDEEGLAVVAVNGFAANVGKEVAGNNGGLFKINADGTWTFEPGDDFDLLEKGESANTLITYAAAHLTSGAREAEATLTVTVGYGNTPPVAVDDLSTTDSDTVVTGNVLTNDTDIDPDTLSVTEVNGVSANVGVPVPGSTGGLFTINADGSWSFDPNLEFNDLPPAGSRDTTVTYTVFDGQDTDEGILTMTVTGALPQLLEFVGSIAGNSADGRNNITLTLPIGIQTGDMVLLAVGCSQTSDRSPYMVTPGYTQVGDWYVDAQFRDPSLAIFYKFMGDTPDATAVCNGATGWGSAASRAVVHVWRNVDPTQPFDVPLEVAGLAVATNVAGGPYSPSITPVTTGAVVIVTGCAALHKDFGTDAFTCPVGVENCISGNSNGTAHDFLLGMGSMAWTGTGAVSPGAWQNRPGDGFGGAGMIAISMALRPA